MDTSISPSKRIQLVGFSSVKQLLSRLLILFLLCIPCLNAYGHDGRYEVIEGGSIVRDLVTGFDWQRCSVGQTWDGMACTETAWAFTWDEALKLTAPGGFVLPDIEQLRTLVYCSNTGEYDSNGNNIACGDWGTYDSPTINTQFFPNTPTSYFWSSSPYTYDSSQAWVVHFNSGFTSGLSPSNSQRVRLVRSGQSLAIGVPQIQTPTEITHTSFSAHWSAVEGATGYRLDVATSSDFTSLLSGYNNYDAGNTTSANISGLQPNTNYYYRVRAYNDSGTSASSDTQSATTTTSQNQSERYAVIEDGSIVRDLVTGLEWQRCSVGQTWDGMACAGTASILIWDEAVALTAPGGFSIPDIVQLRTLVYCSNTNQYDSNGNNDVCGASGTFDSPTINSQFFPNTPVDVYWSGSPNTQSPNYVWAVYFGNGFTYPDSYLTSGIHVRLVRSGQSFVIDAPQSHAPTEITHTSFRANWSVVDGATGYRLDVATSSDFTSLLSGYGNYDAGNSTSADISGLQPNTNYFYRVRAYNDSGTSASSEMQSVTTRQPSRRRGLPAWLYLQ